MDVDGGVVPVRSIQESSASYEKWLGKRLTIVAPDLELKHEKMAENVFEFFRATFYRFVELWLQYGGDATKAPEVLAVGDLHVANYGTWRDSEGRLIWGINDFDEVYPMPYTIDLVRLATSAHLAKESEHLSVAEADACDSILLGYKAGLEAGGVPFVLEKEHGWLRDTVMGELRDPEHFWARMEQLKTTDRDVPADAMRLIDKVLPVGTEVRRVATRVAGLGSLGRERYVVLGDLYGSGVAREAKALCASAALWAGVRGGEPGPMYGEMLSRCARALDPLVKVNKQWIVRRLSPACSRVELASLPAKREESKLLRAMGFELANVHLGTKRAVGAIREDLKARPKKWLHKASLKMKAETLKDFAAWRG